MTNGRRSLSWTDRGRFEMTVSPTNKTTPTDLRRFGLQVGGLIALIFGFVIPFLRHRSVYPIPLAIGGVLILWAVAHPTSLKVVYRPWMAVALVLGRINTAVILTVFFFLVITPMGFLLRLLGKIPIEHTFDREAESYRKTSKALPPDRMERPY